MFADSTPPTPDTAASSRNASRWKWREVQSSLHLDSSLLRRFSGVRRYGRLAAARGFGSLAWAPSARLNVSMDVGQLDAVSAVLGAIAASAGAGAGEAVKDIAKDTITGTRDRLVARVRQRLARDPVGDAKLTVYSAEPTRENGQALHQHLTGAGLDQDPEIVTLARDLLHTAGSAALAPGSVAATVINQVNKDGGTGFIGGQHVHHHGAPTITARVTWELFRLAGQGYELRNTGTVPALDVTVSANVELAWPTAPERNIPAGSSVMFVYDDRLSDPSPILVVTYAEDRNDGRQRWQRPLPQ